MLSTCPHLITDMPTVLFDIGCRTETCTKQYMSTFIVWKNQLWQRTTMMWVNTTIYMTPVLWPPLNYKRNHTHGLDHQGNYRYQCLHFLIMVQHDVYNFSIGLINQVFKLQCLRRWFYFPLKVISGGQKVYFLRLPGQASLKPEPNIIYRCSVHSP